MRSPRATGLASSLSGCFSLTGQRCLFRHRRHGGRFSRILPRSRVLPGPHAPFVPPFGVFLWADLRCRRPPESSVPCWCAVTTAGPLGHCDSPAGRNRPQTTSLDWPRLLIAARRLGSIFAFRRARERPSVEPVNPASIRAAFANRSKRDRTNQPGPIFPRSPGIILNRWASNFHFLPPRCSFNELGTG